MSSREPDSQFVPTIDLVYRANRALQHDIVAEAGRRGHPEIRQAFNTVFANLDASDGGRASDLAAQAGVTRQTMGEIIREMVALDLVEMRTDPDDRRAKIVTFTEDGLARLGEGHRYIGEVEQRLVDLVGETAYRQTRDVLSRLIDLLERGNDESP